ncbi:hypothetical protein N9J66_01255 [Gammaproteobacteria bacterium]|nr:hypothetical protein [Gammaproteobacteria bacterium]
MTVGGTFKLLVTEVFGHGNGVRSLSQIKHEFSISTHGRYRLKSENGSGTVSLIYEKVESVLISGDSINRWSFGIITNGKKSKQVNALIRSIQALHIPEYEILICGPHDSKDPMIKVFGVDSDEEELRGPITKKKNEIGRLAKFENLVILHDRYVFPDNWFFKMKKYGNLFEMLVLPNIGLGGGRVNDWSAFYGNPSQPLSKGTSLLPYNKYSESVYMQGGILIIKKSIFNRITLDENLYWGELEDVVFSKIAHLYGFFTYIDSNNRVLTDSSRLRESRDLNTVEYLLKRTLSYLRQIFLIIVNLSRHWLNSLWSRL